MALTSHRLREEVRIELSAAQQAFAEEVEHFAATQVAPRAAAAEKARAHDPALLEQLRSRGYLGPLVPRQFGGMGLDGVCMVLLIEALSRADAALGFIVSVNADVAAIPILRYGTAHQQEAYLPRLADGFAGFALTEAGAGSDAASQTSTAVLDGDAYVLNGHKRFGTNAPLCGFLTVIAATDPAAGPKGLSAFLVEGDAPGLSLGRREDTMGLRAAQVTDVILQDVRVPTQNLLGRPGDGLRIGLSAIDYGRVGIGAQGVGIASAALTAATAHATRRQQFGRAIADFQAIQFMLADMAVQLETARLLTLRAAVAMDAGGRFSLPAAMAKLAGSVCAKEVADKALQIHGGGGYTTDYPVERYYRDARALEIYEGTTEIMRMVIAKALLEQG